MGAVRVHHPGALYVDSHDGFSLEGVGLAGCIVGTDPADGEEEVDAGKTLGKVSMES